MNTTLLRWMLLWGCIILALHAQGQQGIQVLWKFNPDPLTQDLYLWDIGLKVTNSGQAVDVYPELIIRHNDDVFFHIRRREALEIPNGEIELDRDSDFGDPIFDAFNGQSSGTYELLAYPSQEALAPIVLTRQLPPFKWEFCILLYDAQGSLLTEACRVFFWGDYLPPAPILPAYDLVLDRYTPIRFQWSPVTPRRGFEQSVLLQVYEMLPGQDEVDALRSNPAIVEQVVKQNAWWIWSPSGMALNPGDSMQYVWQVTALEPAAILTQENGPVSLPATFWLKDPRPVINPAEVLCDSINAGPDLFQEGPEAPRVRIGCDPKVGRKYEWMSDPPTCHASSSLIAVRPAQTTRYILIQTGDSGRCEVYDEVYVIVKTNFKAELKSDPCGEISAEIVPNPDDKTKPSFSRNTKATRQAIPEQVDTAVIANGVPYDINGDVIGDDAMPAMGCGMLMPAPQSPPPTVPYNYLWNTGEMTPTIHPESAGTYSCTVSEGGRRAKDSIDFAPSAKFSGDFTYMVYTQEMRLNDPQRPFVIRQNGNEDGAMPAYNARGYAIEITGPDAYQLLLEASTIEGFADGEIRWEGGPDRKGIRAKPGTYTARVSFINCDHPVHSDTRRYNFSYVADFPVPLNQAKSEGRINTFEFKVKAASKPKRKEAL
jgi:hypothetical protein